MTDSRKQQLDAILAEETSLVFGRFTFDDAWSLGTRLAALAAERDLPVAVDIRAYGRVLFHINRDGASGDNDAWVERKIALVERFGHSSWYYSRLLAWSGQTMEDMFLIPESDFAPHGGCLPVRLTGGGPVGTITVSGLPQEQDHALVVEAVRAHLAASS